MGLAFIVVRVFAQTPPVELSDGTELHVHEENQQFTVNVAANHRISFQWQDYLGNAHGEVMTVAPGERVTTTTPSLSPGYYGLRVQTIDASVAASQQGLGKNREAPREYGFVILPADGNRRAPREEASPFGIVHADIDDEHLPTWIKTKTWKTRKRLKSWNVFFEKIDNRGFIEVPLIAGEPWRTDDRRAIAADELERVREALTLLLSICPRQLLYLELGREENLQSYFRNEFYWQNLATKVALVKQAAKSLDCEVRLIYQIANLRRKPIHAFAQSAAAKHFDILSLHPYAWQDFPDPAHWLPKYLQDVKDSLKENGLNMPIWFTEVGVPQRTLDPTAFFGYPAKGREVAGRTRTSAVSYMARLHIVALSRGVERIFWYNYQDRSPSKIHAEAHFGIRDFWGFPLPVYATYYNLHQRINTKSFRSHKRIGEHVHSFEFVEGCDHFWGVWSNAEMSLEVPLDYIDAALLHMKQRRITDAVGKPLGLKANSIIEVGQHPVFIDARMDAKRCRP